MSSRYSGAHFKRGLMSFIFGKALSALSGFLAMVLIVRALTVPEFASYSVLISLVEVFSAISALGLAHALLRYVPELYAKHYKVALQRFISSAILIRSVVLVIAVWVFYLWSPFFSSLIGLENFLKAFEMYLIVVVLRTSSNFISLILESTLHQGYTQFGYAINSVSRLMGVLYLINFDHASLFDVIVVEIFSEAIGLIVLLVGLAQVIWFSPSEKPPPEDDGLWLNGHLKLIKKFAINGYLQHLAGIPFGSNTNRLIGGNMFGSQIMASFGFANSLYEYAKRYLPAQLLVGLIRPVVVARFSLTKNFSLAAQTCNRVILINIALIGAMITGLLVGGHQLLTWVSAGKYGYDALVVLIALLFVLAFETNRLTLEILVQAVERYELLIPTNIFLSLSVVPALLLFPYLGAVAFPLANALALIVSNYLVERKLSSLNYVISHQWLEITKIVSIVFISTSIGKVLIEINLNWLVASIIALVAFLYLILLTQRSVFKSFVQDMMGSKNGIQ